LGIEEELDAALDSGVLGGGAGGGEGFESESGESGAGGVGVGEGAGEGEGRAGGAVEVGLAGGPAAVAVLLAAEPLEGLGRDFLGGSGAVEGEEGECGFLGVGVKFGGELAGPGGAGQALTAEPGGGFGGGRPEYRAWVEGPFEGSSKV